MMVVTGTKPKVVARDLTHGGYTSSGGIDPDNLRSAVIGLRIPNSDLCSQANNYESRIDKPGNS